MIDISHIITLDKWLQLYLICKVIDFATGFLKAYKIEGFKSRKLRDGVISTVGEVIAIFFSGLLDCVLELNIILLSTQMLFIFKEAISIVENLGIIGVKLPDIITEKIQDLNPNRKNDKSEGGN